MAIVIFSQPTKDFIVSSLLPININYTENTSTTINLVCQVQYWTGSAWTNWGGQIRCANRLGFPGSFYLDISDLVCGLPQGDLTDLNGLGSGPYCWGGSYTVFRETLWEYKSDWKVRVNAQREYLSSSTGLIKLSDTVKQSNSFYVHQGATSLGQAKFATRIPGDKSLEAYNHRQVALNTGYNWQWMTDNQYQNRYPKVPGLMSTGYQLLQEYRTEITPDEQFYISCINGQLGNGFNPNKLIIKTINGTIIANSHTHVWSTPPQNDGYVSIDVGLRSLIGILTPNVDEGVDFERVTHYYVYNKLDGAQAGSTGLSLPWRFDVDRSCSPMGLDNPYRRFAWKTKLGSYDMFSSKGMVKIKKKVKSRQFEKRLGPTGYQDHGDTKYQATTEEVTTVESHEISDIAANWFSCIAESVEVWLRVDTQGKLKRGEVDGLGFFNFDETEDWRDDSRCNSWMPIIILSKSVTIFKTGDNTNRVKFDYTLAQKNVTPRR